MKYQNSLILQASMYETSKTVWKVYKYWHKYMNPHYFLI